MGYMCEWASGQEKVTQYSGVSLKQQVCDCSMQEEAGRVQGLHGANSQLMQPHLTCPSYLLGCLSFGLMNRFL